MVDHAQDEDAEPGAGQAPVAAAPPAPAPRWDPLNPAPDPDLPQSEGLGEGERVAKALARAGVASRREVERYIEAGRVALNGKVLDTPAVKVAPGDILTVDGAVVGGPEPTRLFRYHKPSGLITTNSDPQRRPTVFEHLPEWLPRVLAVGRLDLNTEGLLLLTNDGALSRALELPSSGWMRRYRARAFGRIDQGKLDTLVEGVTVDGVSYGPIEARLDKATGHDRESGAANVWISIGITEGKNREVRKVLEHLGLKVNRLIRLAYGPFALGTLEVGQVEEVGPRVIREQLAEHVAPENLPTGDRVIAPPPQPSPPRPRVEVASPRRPAPPKPVAGRRDQGFKPPAEGAERRLAETPRKGARPVWAGAKGRPAASDRPRGDRPASGAPGKPARPGPSRGWVDKPGSGRSDSAGPGKPAFRDGPRAEPPRAEPPRAERARTDRPKADRLEIDRPGTDRPRGEAPSGDRPFGAKPARGPGGGGKKFGDRAASKPGAPGRAFAKGGKPGTKPGPKGGQGKSAAPAATPSRTGLELTPPMRRTPRSAGPRRPPRKD